MKHEEDWLDTLLHDDAQHAVADAGFTARVMQRLPAPVMAVDSASDNRFMRWSLIGACVGTLIALLDGAWPDTEVMSASIASLVHLHSSNVQPLAPWLATLLVAAVLAYVLLEEPG